MPDLFDALTLPSAGTTLSILLDLTLKGTLLLALAGLLTSLLRRASASTRHLIWCLALCSLFIIPVLSGILPAWRVVPVPDVVLPVDLEQTPFAPAAPLVPEADATQPPEPAARSQAPASPAFTIPAQDGMVMSAFASLYEALRSAHWTTWLMLLWAGGALVVMLNYIIGAMGVFWLGLGAERIRDQDWLDLNDEVGDRLYLTRPVKLLRSRRTAMPMTWGFRRPVVLLPIDAGAWSYNRRRCVLTHELAHIKRWDCLTQLLAQVACAIMWFNPLAWIAARQMRLEREQACDDYVITTGTKPSDYAKHLIDIAHSTRATMTVPLGAVSMARPSQLEGRVLAILDPKRRRSQQGRMLTRVAFALTFAMVLPLAAMQPIEDTRPEAIPMETTSLELPAPADDIQIPAGTSRNYTWTGQLDPGQTIEVKSLWGNIEAVPARGRTVEVIARQQHGTMGQMVRVIEYRGGITVCAPHATWNGVCKPGDWFPEGRGDDTEVNVQVRVPAGVTLVAHTVDGDIRAVGLSSVVRAKTTDGDIHIDTHEYAEAHTVDGDIKARLGATTWRGTLRFSTVDGDLLLDLPDHADLKLDAQVEADGRIHSDYTLNHSRLGDGERQWGTLGRGGRRLSMYTVDGNIDLRGTNLPSRTRRSTTVWMRDAEARHASSEGNHQGSSSYGHGAVANYLEVLSEGSESKRLRAVKALQHEGSAPAITLLSHTLTEDRSEKVRKQAAHALGRIGCDNAVPALFAALEDRSSEVRQMVVWALGEIDDERADEALEGALYSRDREVRDRAARSLQKRGYAVASGYAVTDASSNTYLPHVGEPVQLQFGDIDISIDGQMLDLIAGVLSDLDINLETESFEVALDGKALAKMALDLAAGNDDYARSMRALHIDGVNTETLIAARMLGITPSYVRNIRNAGYCPDFEDLVQLKATGVQPQYLSMLASFGHGDLDVEELVALHTAGVDRDFLRDMAAAGYEKLRADELLELRRYRIDRSFIESHTATGQAHRDQQSWRQHTQNQTIRSVQPPSVEKIVHLKQTDDYIEVRNSR